MRQEISTTQEKESSQAMKMEQYYNLGCEPDAESEEYTTQDNMWWEIGRVRLVCRMQYS